MRHIGYVLKRFPRISETFVAAEILELERQGERVSIFAVSRPDEPFSHAFVGQIAAPVIYLPYRPAHQLRRVGAALARVIRSNPMGWLRAAVACAWPPRIVAWRHLMQATVLTDEMARRGVTHAHAHFASTAARLANLAWRMGGPTYSVTAHAKDIYHEEVQPEHLREKLLGATFVATVSDANRRHLAEVLGMERAPELVPNSVDLERLGAPPDRRPAERLVLAVGRLVEKKGLVYLIEASALLQRRGCSFSLALVGDGPLRSELEAAAARLGVPAEFHGALPQEEAVRLYRRATAFCLPCVIARTGDRDGLPTSVLEAMALGVPVVTTPVNGLVDVVVDGVTGLLVPERDPNALADALEKVLTDDRLAEELSRRARALVEERFSVRRSVEQLRSHFPKAA